MAAVYMLAVFFRYGISMKPALGEERGRARNGGSRYMTCVLEIPGSSGMMKIREKKFSSPKPRLEDNPRLSPRARR